MTISRELARDIKREVLKNNYFEFFKFAFEILHPGTKYSDNFHVKYLCDLLQEEAERILQKIEKDKDLLINIPPRTSKSLIFSVCFLPWVWLRDPSKKFICISNDDQLALLNSQYSRDIIAHPEYQELFSDCFTIRPDIDSKGYFANNYGGYRLSRSSGTNVTGYSCDYCFTGDQLVATDQGQISIKDIVENKLDVRVLTHNHITGTDEYQKVERYEKNPLGKRRLVKITTSNGEIKCTEDHLIWSVTRNKYIEARDLQEGEEVKSAKN